MDKKQVAIFAAAAAIVIYSQARYISKLEKKNRKLRIWSKTVQPLLLEVIPQIPDHLEISQRTKDAIAFYLIVEKEI